MTLNAPLTGRAVDFLEIDIEGYELQALQGAIGVLPSINKVMAEVTENHAELADSYNIVWLFAS